MGNGYLSIAEVARELGVSPRTIRSWERRYDLVSPTRTLGGHRRYPEPAIRELAASLVAEVGAS